MMISADLAAASVVRDLRDYLLRFAFGDPGLQVGDQRRAEFLADGLAPFSALAVDRPLDLE